MSTEALVLLTIIGLALLFGAYLLWFAGDGKDFSTVEAKENSGDYADNYTTYP